MIEELLGVLDFEKYKHKKQIISELRSNEINLDERLFRRLVQKNNNKFAEGIVDYYIAHCSKGYKKTFEWNEMKKSIQDNRKRAITMLIECDKAEKQFQRRNNLRLELGDKYGNKI